MHRRLLLVPLLFIACGNANDIVEPQLGKGDVLDGVRDLGALEFGGERRGDFGFDLQFDAYRVAIGRNSTVSFEVTQLGSSSRLDTTMFVFGPSHPSVGFGSVARFTDDDAGHGDLSKLREIDLDAGEYLVVLGTPNALGRGHYRVTATCHSGDCSDAPDDPTECHPVARQAILDCLDEETGVSGEPVDANLISLCTEIFVVPFELFQEICAEPDPPEFCQSSVETFEFVHWPLCIAEVEEMFLP